jgi:hypothetical protein
MVRNAQMGDYATALVAFPTKDSIGTRGMISYMKKLNKKTHVVETAVLK